MLEDKGLTLGVSNSAIGELLTNSPPDELIKPNGMFWRVENAVSFSI